MSATLRHIHVVLTADSHVCFEDTEDQSKSLAPPRARRHPRQGTTRGKDCSVFHHATQTSYIASLSENQRCAHAVTFTDQRINTLSCGHFAATERTKSAPEHKPPQLATFAQTTTPATSTVESPHECEKGRKRCKNGLHATVRVMIPSPHATEHSPQLLVTRVGKSVPTASPKSSDTKVAQDSVRPSSTVWQSSTRTTSSSVSKSDDVTPAHHRRLC